MNELEVLFQAQQRRRPYAPSYLSGPGALLLVLVLLVGVLGGFAVGVAFEELREFRFDWGAP